MNLFNEAVKLQDGRFPFAIATIISAQGSTPRNTAKMIVKADGGIIGTIGGGLAEAFVINEALDAIVGNRSKVVDYILDSDTAGGIQMLCGGKISVFIEVVSPMPRIVMVGAGHVGMAVARLTAFLGYQLVIVDERPEFANSEKYPMAAEIYCCRDLKAISDALRIDGHTSVIIATDEWDLAALRDVIDSEAAYIGMIGSGRKVGIVKEQLQKEGFSVEKLNRIYAPVGLDIGSETPEEIALSILAEILKVKSGKTGLSLKETK